MTETPGRPSDPAPDPNSDATTEPTPVTTSIPAAAVTGTTPSAGKPRVRWRWPEKTRNRIAASVAIAAGTVAVVAAIFTSGVMVGAHANVGENHRWVHHSAMSPHGEGTPTEQIWIMPGDAAATGHDGYIVTGSVATAYD